MGEKPNETKEPSLDCRGCKKLSKNAVKLKSKFFLEGFPKENKEYLSGYFTIFCFVLGEGCLLSLGGGRRFL